MFIYSCLLTYSQKLENFVTFFYKTIINLTAKENFH